MKTKGRILVEKFAKEKQEAIFEDVNINDLRLKKEWLKQPVLVMQYSTLATEARKEKDLVARKIKVCHARLTKRIWDKPSKFLPRGRDKLTEAIVESHIECHEEYTNLQEELIAKEYEYQMWRNVVDSLNDKRKALEEVQELYMRSFYSSPTEISANDFKVRQKLNK